MSLLLTSKIGSGYWDLSSTAFWVIVALICFFALVAIGLFVLLMMLVKNRSAAPAEQAAVAEESAVKEEPAAATAVREPVVIPEESFAGGTLRYNKSFTARLIQSDDQVKNAYTDLKNMILSYENVHDRMSWKRETYRLGGDAVAKLAFRGNTMCLYLPLDPKDYVDSKFKVEDVSDSAANEDTPLMYRLKNARRFKYAEELVAEMMSRRGAAKTDREAQDYYLPYEGLMELIKKGLIKRTVKAAGSEDFFRNADATEEDKAPVEIAPGIFVVPESDDEE